MKIKEIIFKAKERREAKKRIKEDREFIVALWKLAKRAEEES